MDTRPGVRLDADSLSVLAHPLRSRLLSTLRTNGPATATDLATSLVSNTGATSYHLRKLESVGLVSDTDKGHGKRRLWQATTESHQFTPGDFAGNETAEADLNWLGRTYARNLGERFEAWLDVEPSWPIDWRNAAGLNDDFVTLTPAQTQAMSAEIAEVIARYRTAGTGNPEARRLSVWRIIYPNDPHHAPEEGRE